LPVINFIEFKLGITIVFAATLYQFVIDIYGWVSQFALIVWLYDRGKNEMLHFPYKFITNDSNGIG